MTSHFIKSSSNYIRLDIHAGYYYFRIDTIYQKLHIYVDFMHALYGESGLCFNQNLKSKNLHYYPLLFAYSTFIWNHFRFSN